MHGIVVPFHDLASGAELDDLRALARAAG